ncbi:MAG: tRNA adenosine(34) deaminase TadA [Slackia sp.]|nr:tRNA adenosine(34) deaminase TadA [Slackia sp.]
MAKARGAASQRYGGAMDHLDPPLFVEMLPNGFAPGADERMARDELFMRMALDQAREAAKAGEVPIGAVVVFQDEVIAQARNHREADGDPSAHAEFSAVVQASRELERWRLPDCTVYVTLEPCIMCAGLMHQARIGRCVYGAADAKAGALGSLYRIHDDARLNHRFAVRAGVLEQECTAVLRSFFEQRRLDDRSE